MSKFISLMITLVVSMFTLNAMAFDAPSTPSDGTYIVDQTGKLSASQKTQLNNKIEQVNRATKNEFGILLLNDMGGASIEDVANTTYKKWGIGKRGLDNGCLIVVALKERKSRIETGKGVEGDVPDLRANDILKRNLNPHLKSGDFYGAFDDTLSALSSQIESRHAQKADPPPAQASNPVTTDQPVTSTGRSNSGGCSMTDGGSPFGVGAFILFCIVAGVLLARRAARKAEARMRQAEEDHREEVARQAREAAAREAQARVAENFKRDREEAERMRLEREARARNAERERLASIPTPVVAIPVVTKRDNVVPRPSRTVTKTAPVADNFPAKHAAAVAVTAVASATAVALLEEERNRAKRRAEERAEEQRAEARREEERREARRAQERRDEEDRRRRQREDDDRSSSSSSSSSWGGGSDSGGSGFGGGDSGGGGSSSDW